MQQDGEQQHGGDGGEGKGQTGGNGHGPRRIHLRVQTPRGLWSMTEPSIAARRPEYSIETTVAAVIADARTVFQFVEQDSLYTLFLGTTPLALERPLVSYGIVDDTLLVLSVQGGNATDQ